MTDYVGEHRLNDGGQTLSTLAARVKVFDRLERLRAAGAWLRLYPDGRHDPYAGQVRVDARQRVQMRLHRHVQTRRGELHDARALGIDIYGLREARRAYFDMPRSAEQRRGERALYPPIR